MVEWIISSSVLILVVAAVRYAFRGKIGLRLQYALWALVLIRLLVPFSLFASHVSAANLAPAQIVSDTRIQLPALHAVQAAEPVPATATDIQTPSDTAAPVPSIQTVIRWIWLGGMCITALVLLTSNLSFYAKLKRTRQRLSCDYAMPVYVCQTLPTPCMLAGAIYVTDEVAHNTLKLRHVLAHEYIHYRHGDGVWSVLRCLCLAIHWFNPLVWWAASLSKRDAELACDEGAIAAVGESERMDYGRTLIELTAKTAGARDILCCATTMTGGRKNIKERIELIAKKPKNIISTIVIVALICAIAAGCSFGGAAADPVDKIEESIAFTTGDNQVVTMSYTVPNGVASLNVVGHYVLDSGSGYSFHDELEAAKGAHEGYMINFMDFTELYMEVVLENGKTGEIDLLQHYKEAGMPLRGSTNMWDAEITFYVEGTEETVPANYWTIGEASILIPASGWSQTGDGDKLCFTPDNVENVSVRFEKYLAVSFQEVQPYLGVSDAQPMDTDPWMYIGDTQGVVSRQEGDGKTVVTHMIEHMGDVYAIVCTSPIDDSEGWGARLETIANTMVFNANGNQYAPTGLTKDTTTGVGVFLDYADAHKVIFHGYFGLFVYDLDDQQIIGAFDLEKTVGSTNVQGSEGAGVEVSSDGKTVLLYHYIEDGAPDKAVYISTDSMICTKGVYKELPNRFAGVEDMSHPEMSYNGAPYIQETDGTLGGLHYVDDDMVWSLFESYFAN